MASNRSPNSRPSIGRNQLTQAVAPVRPYLPKRREGGVGELMRKLALTDVAPESRTAPEAGSDAVVVLDQVVKRFGSVTAVDNLSLEIGRGEFFSLLGPSGCGKTTTLRMIGGFESPTEGRVALDGDDVTDIPAYRRDVNTVFQSYGLFPHLNVFDNVAFGLRRRKIPARYVQTRVTEALKLVTLSGYQKRRPNQLSGGQQQRVALARALVNWPKVLLLDEPLGALDLKLRKQMQLELKRIQHEVGITFIHVTHDQEEAMTMADRIAVMDDGHIEQLGTPGELYETPQTRFVAGFLGVSNLISAEVRNGGVVARDGTALRVAADALAGKSGPVAIGVRPEKIHLNGDEANRIPGRVAESAYI